MKGATMSPFHIGLLVGFLVGLALGISISGFVHIWIEEKSKNRIRELQNQLYVQRQRRVDA